MICLEPLESIIQEDIICSSCQSKIIRHKKIYHIHGVDWYILYEYNEFLERLFFQFKEQKDIALAPVFLYTEKNVLQKWMKKDCVCGLCSSEQKRMERGFEPLELIFSAIDIHIYSPLYKTDNIKQSQLHASQRGKIKNSIKRKSAYSLPDKNICLVDDVCTTGASMERACELLHPKKVFILAAHPLWIEKHQRNRVENKAWIC